jgi:hypothetical protein
MLCWRIFFLNLSDFKLLIRVMRINMFFLLWLTLFLLQFFLWLVTKLCTIISILWLFGLLTVHNKDLFLGQFLRLYVRIVLSNLIVDINNLIKIWRKVCDICLYLNCSVFLGCLNFLSLHWYFIAFLKSNACIDSKKICNGRFIFNFIQIYLV